MAEGLFNPLDSNGTNQIKLFRASECEDVVRGNKKIIKVTTGSVCNSQRGRQKR